jgi:hypothetical protein
MKQYRPRDRTFLRFAWLAGIGGLLNVGFSVGMPLEKYLHHEPWSPAFFFFALWGLIAFYGCGACIYTYLTSGDPPGDRPPPGGLRERSFQVIEGGAKTEAASDRTKRAA